MSWVEARLRRGGSSSTSRSSDDDEYDSRGTDVCGGTEGSSGIQCEVVCVRSSCGLAMMDIKADRRSIYGQEKTGRLCSGKGRVYVYMCAETEQVRYHLLDAVDLGHRW